MAAKKDLGTYQGLGVKTATVADDIDIGPDLTKHMSRQPGLFAYYAGVSEEALHKAKRIKYEIYCLQEDLDYAIRRKAKEKGEKLPTEGAIKARINRHPEVRKKYEEYLEAKRVSGLLGMLTKAFEQRADMLRSIGAMRRRELDQSEIQTLRSKAKAVTKSLRSGTGSDEE